MSKNIIRPKKRKNPYVMLDKECLNNKALSFKAKGLHAYLISKPDDWIVMMAELVSSAVEGRDSIRKAFKELENAGYIKREPKRGNDGKLKGTATLVYERSTDSLNISGSANEDNADNQASGLPSDGESPTTNEGDIPMKEETIGSLSQSNNTEHKPKRASTPKPPSPFTAEAKKLAFDLIRKTEEAMGRTISTTVAMSYKSIVTLLDRGVKAERIEQGIDWLCKENMKREPKFVLRVQSGSALLKKWERVESGLDTDRPSPKDSIKDSRTLPEGEYIWK